MLFFPGASVEIGSDDPSARFNGKRLDHITLDASIGADKYSSHVAVQDPRLQKSRGIPYTSTPPSGYMAPWFSLLMPDLHGFYRLPQKLSIRFPSPRPDLVHFGEQLLGEGGIAFVPLPPSASSPNYIQFDVWSGQESGWQNLQVRPIAWAYKPEIVADPPTSEQEIKVNRVNIEFSTTAGIVVVVSRPAGRLLEPRILRPTLKW